MQFINLDSTLNTGTQPRGHFLVEAAAERTEAPELVSGIRTAG